MEIPWNLFYKLFQGKISEFEKRQLELWKDASNVNLLLYKEIMDDEGVKKALINKKWEDSTKDWNKVLSKIHKPVSRISVSTVKLRYITGITAAILLLLVIFSGIWYYELKNIKSSKGNTYIFSPRGQRTYVVLPDNTKVWLNSESTIQYPANFNRKNRKVMLSGEAFFEVTKDPQNPFWVNANEINVKVYGTSFNLKAFPYEKYIETTLIEGKLSVIPVKNKDKAVQEIVLKPSEKLIYKKGTQELIRNGISITNRVNDTNQEKEEKQPKVNKPEIIIQKQSDLDKEKKWKDGKLIFKNESFEELAIRLERWYDVKIHFEDEALKKFIFTGVFEKETINQAMEALLLSSQKSYKYKMEYRDIYIKQH